MLDVVLNGKLAGGEVSCALSFWEKFGGSKVNGCEGQSGVLPLCPLAGWAYVEWFVVGEGHEINLSIFAVFTLGIFSGKDGLCNFGHW